jgi:hypothetical protein
MSRRAARLAAGLLALYVGLESLALVLSIRSGQHDDAILGLGTLALATVGALVASRRAGNPIGWIMLAIAILSAFSGLGEGYFVASPDPASLPLGTTMLWVSQWITWVWLALAVIFLPLLFPDGRLPSPRWRAVPWVAGTAVLLAVAGDAFRPGRLEADDPAVFVENPLGIGGPL